VAQKIIGLRKAAPFILGANVGTTITAFIAVTLNSNTTSALSIAVAHFLFNFIGVIVFYLIPVLREIPLKLANGLGKLTLKYRLAGFAYILLMFFVIPFSLIYFNQDAVQMLEITYERTDTTKLRSSFRIISKMNSQSKSGEWISYNAESNNAENSPSIIPMSLKKNTLFAGDEVYQFNEPGFCWYGENKKGKFKSCITDIIPSIRLSDDLSFDSVYVYRQILYSPMGDSLITQTYISSRYLIVVKKETVSPDHKILFSEKIIRFTKNLNQH
jgi:sodium-dependent phosphate cotransporter